MRKYLIPSIALTVGMGVGNLTHYIWHSQTPHAEPAIELPVHPPEQKQCYNVGWWEFCERDSTHDDLKQLEKCYDILRKREFSGH